MSKYLQQLQKQGASLDEIIPLDVSSYKELVEALKKLPEQKPIPTGIGGLDELMGGFKEEKMYVLSAPTKMGKTTLAQTIMYNMAKQGNPSLFFSYEMSWQEVARKYMAMDKKTLSDEPTDLPMFVPMELQRGGGELQFQWLYETIAKAKEEKGIKLVVIDHLHFLLPLRDFKNTSFIIGGIVREIKKMAVSLKVPIILISHVAKIKDDKKPDWTDIRDSSFITQEADAVLMMYRVKKEGERKKISDDSTESIYLNRSILSLELDRERGVSGKIGLFHNGAMFEEDDQYGTKDFVETFRENKLDNIKF